jgi:hypothetical protein
MLQSLAWAQRINFRARSRIQREVTIPWVGNQNLFVRDLSFVRNRLKEAPQIRVLNDLI